MLRSYFCVGTILAPAVAVMLAQGPTATKVAFVKDGQIYVADGTGSPARQITSDTTSKQLVAWSPSGDSLAYFEAMDNASRGRLVVASSSGDERAAVPIHGAPGATGGFRFVEKGQWISSSVIVLGGSVNPNNCEYVTVSVTSKQVLGDVIAECGSFGASPDSTHSAGIEPNREGIPESEWRDYLLIDGKVVYPQGPSAIKILAGPTWEDNGAVAIIEKGVVTGTVKATVVTADGRATSMLLPLGDVDQNSLQYHRGQLLLSLNGGLVALEPSGNTLRPASPDELAADSARKENLGIHKQLDLGAQQIAEKSGGRNGIAWSPSAVE